MTPTDRSRLETLLHSDAVTEPTRQVLLARLDERFEPQFFDAAEFAFLRAVSLRLVPHDPAEMDLAGRVGARLARGETDGWRFDACPPDGESHRRLLRALPPDFVDLSGDAQDAALHQLQHNLPFAFEELLAELTEGYMSHPLTQLRLGCLSFADALGWHQIGLNEAEPREEGHVRTS